MCWEEAKVSDADVDGLQSVWDVLGALAFALAALKQWQCGSVSPERPQKVHSKEAKRREAIDAIKLMLLKASDAIELIR